MLQFLKRLFCFHEYDYESDIFIQVECRNCGKPKSNPRHFGGILPNVLRHIKALSFDGAFSFLIGGKNANESNWFGDGGGRTWI